ncbi:hypothetical protein Hanom_Chr02g00145871 [Helianthus anomalus]
MSPMGMVRVRHFEFICRSQGEDLTREENLDHPPKSFHDWKMKFFYIRAEVIPMAMQFRRMGPVPKEDMAIPHDAAWYGKLMALPNRVFGEQVLIAARMSDKWPEDSESVHVLLFDGQAGPHVMAKKPKRASKKKTATAGGTANKKTEVASATSDTASQKGNSHIRQSRIEDFVYAAEYLERLHIIGGKPQGSRNAGSVGSKGHDSSTAPIVEEPEEDPVPKELIQKNAAKRSREETKTETPLPQRRLPLANPLGRKEVREATILKFRLVVAKKAEVTKKQPSTRPKITVIPPKTIVAEGKSGEVEKTVAKETDAAKAGKALEVTKAPKFVKVTGGHLPVIERTDPEAQVENPTTQHTGPIQTDTVKSTTGESAGGGHTGGGVKNATSGGGNAGGSGIDTRKGALGKRPRQPSRIRAEDTLGDIYYKTYDESRTNELHAPV